MVADAVEGALVKNEVGSELPILFVAEELEHEELRIGDPGVDGSRCHTVYTSIVC